MSNQSSRGKEWKALAQQVLEEGAGVCVYCSGEADTVDHVIPKNAGGTDDRENLVAACRRCNGKKQDRLMVRQHWLNSKYKY